MGTFEGYRDRVGKITPNSSSGVSVQQDVGSNPRLSSGRDTDVSHGKTLDYLLLSTRWYMGTFERCRG